MDFSGFDDWVPIFAGGKQIDSHGIEHDGDELIDKAIASFDPEYHEPPVVVGHPKDNTPAFGWVSALKKAVQKLRDGSTINVLMAKFKDIVPEFAQAVRQGLYKKRSASFYPDGRLRHVGFLGGMPPAVKGLADIAFGDDMSLEFEDHFKMKGEQQMERTYTEAELQAQLAAERERIAAEFAEKTKLAEESAQQKEAEMAKLLADARKAGEEAARREFAEQMRKLKEDAKRQEIAQFITSGIKEGRILPAWEKMGLAQFMESLPNDQPISFGEGDAKGEKTSYEFFKAFLAELPKTVNFGEFAGREKDIKAGGRASDQLNLLIAQKIKDNPTITYTAAFAEVQRENPDVVKEYEQEIAGRAI